MLASQALQRVLNLAENSGQYYHGGSEEERQAETARFEHDQEALKVCTDILSVAVPLARFRCYVTVEKIGDRSKLGLGDFTVCGLDIPAIKNGLIGLSMEPLSVYIQLWEHREEGKFDMVCGYQGQTKNLGYRNWLRDIDRHNSPRETNVIQVSEKFQGGVGKKAAERFNNAKDPRDNGSSQS